jgi:carbon-monoxide dehydrogenase medium subunit
MLALRLTRFEHLVDLNGFDALAGVSRDNGHLRIGAMTRQATVEHSDEVARSTPLLSRATPLIGHFQIRNRGTVGGSLTHADPASEYPAVALALNARLEIAGPAGGRMVPAGEFFLSTWVTSLEAPELLVAMIVPVQDGRAGSAIEEVSRRHGDFALVGAACSIRLGDDDRVDSAGVALFGVGPTAVQATNAETALGGRSVGDLGDAALAELGQLAAADLEPPDDVHASSRYRKKVGARLVARALDRALREAAHG